MRNIALLAIALAAAPSYARVPRCRFGPGNLPATTRPGKAHGAHIPIDNIVVLMQENRSFHHYMGSLHSEGQPRAKAEPANASNPDPTHPMRPPRTPFDLRPHGRGGAARHVEDLLQPGGVRRALLRERPRPDDEAGARLPVLHGCGRRQSPAGGVRRSDAHQLEERRERRASTVERPG